MADLKSYTALTTVRLGTGKVLRGQPLQLADKDAAPLLNLKAIAPAVSADAPPADDPVLDELVKLDAMTKAQLVEYASQTHGLTLNPTSRKDELVAAIQTAEGKA